MLVCMRQKCTNTNVWVMSEEVIVTLFKVDVSIIGC